jgi:hypothetical protein
MLRRKHNTYIEIFRVRMGVISSMLIMQVRRGKLIVPYYQFSICWHFCTSNILPINVKYIDVLYPYLSLLVE